MRHKVFGNQLGRNTKQARALYRGLVKEVLDHGKIETTLAKAKAIQGLVDKVINFAKKNTVNAKREVVKTLGGDHLLKKIFSEVAPKFSNRNSGYTRIIRLGQRFSDTTEKVILELVEGVEVPTVPGGNEIKERKVEVEKEKKETTGKKKIVKKKKS